MIIRCISLFFNPQVQQGRTCNTKTSKVGAYTAIVLSQSNLSLRPPDKSDHLKIAGTQFQSLQSADSNVWSAFWKMRPPEKCELRTPKVGPKCRFNLRKVTTYVTLSEKHFLDCLTFPSRALRTSDHGVCKLYLARSLPITLPLTRGNHWSLMSWLEQGHVYNSTLKCFERNLANETTWKIGPPTASPFGGRNSQVWLYWVSWPC